MRKAFTIIELMMVVGIIGILIGIVTTAISGSIKQAREHKANASCKVVEQAIATYYAQKGEWPGSIGSQIASGSLGTRSNDLGINNSDDPNIFVLNEAEVDDIVRTIVLESKKGNPLLDISGLFVSKKSGPKGSKNSGMDFMTAIHGTKKSPQKMSLSQMHFGYQDSNTGYFRTFHIRYLIVNDEMKVMTQP